MKNSTVLVCILSVFLLVTLACSNSGTKNYDAKPIASTSQNFSDITSDPEYASNTMPIVEPATQQQQQQQQQAKSPFKAAVVIAEAASLRKSPSQNGEVIDSLSEDASLEVVKQKGAWFLVRTEDGLEGWLHGNTIRYTDNTQSGGWTVSRDLKVAPETNTRYALPESEFIPTLPAETIEVETRRAETLETPVPVYRTTPEPTYSRRGETSTAIREENSSTPTALCADGTYSYSANRRGTCSWHGGVAQWLNSSPSSSSPTYSSPRRSSSSSSSSDDSQYRPKTVNVRGYTRRDGTYVAPYTRSAPRRRN